jgi:hypothetical protein
MMPAATAYRLPAPGIACKLQAQALAVLAGGRPQPQAGATDDAHHQARLAQTDDRLGEHIWPRFLTTKTEGQWHDRALFTY